MQRKHTQIRCKSLVFALGVILKEALKEAHITPGELAKRVVMKKSYIS